MKTSKIISIMLAFALLFLSCTALAADRTGKTVTVMVDHDFRVDDIGNYLSAKYPDVGFDFVYVCSTSDVLTVAPGRKNEEHNGPCIVAGEGKKDMDYSACDGFTAPADHVIVYRLAYFEDGGVIAAPADYIGVK